MCLVFRTPSLATPGRYLTVSCNEMSVDLLDRTPLPAVFARLGYMGPSLFQSLHTGPA